MKRITLFSTLLTVMMTVVLGCSKSEENMEVASEDGVIKLSLTGELGEYTADDVKGQLVNSVRVKWNNTDKVYVYDASKCLGVLDVTPKADGKSADLNGSIDSPAGGTTVLTLVSGSSFTASKGETLTDGKIKYDMSSQEGDKAPYMVYGTLPYSSAVSDLNVQFSFATSVIRVNCTGLVPEADITKSEITGLNTVCVITVNGTGVPDVSSDIQSTIVRTGDSGFTKADANGTGTFSVATVTTSQSDRLLKVYQGEESVSAPFTKGGELKYNQSYNTIVILKKTFTITANPNNETYGTVTGGGAFYDGTQVTLNATPKEGYNFAYWTTNGTESGKIPDAGATYTFKVTEDATYTAVFKVNTPKGGISGLFTVSSGKQVYFSQGNLYCTNYNNATNIKWYFENHQYDFHLYSGYSSNNAVVEGKMISMTSSDYTSGFFGWSGDQSSYCKYGICTSGYKSGTSNHSGSFNEWGNNTIENADSGWRTLSKNEWYYLFYTRTDASNLRKFVSITGITNAGDFANYLMGVILLPDNWWDAQFNHESLKASYTKEEIDELGKEGAVYLPMLGSYSGSLENCYLNKKTPVGSYWTSDLDGQYNAYIFEMNKDSITNYKSVNRYKMRSVRLVMNKE